jgi:uncharacterized protein (DUF1778 family)
MPRLGLYLTDEEYQLIHNAAHTEKRSMNTWCIMALMSRIQGTKTITSTITQGDALILQKRDGRGKFTKRGE